MSSSIQRAFAQGSLYTLFQGIGMLVSLVSFPIVARILTVEEYGELALFNATVAILLAASKCGMSASFIRRYATVDAAGDDRQTLYSSALVASLTFAVAIAVLYTMGVLGIEAVGYSFGPILLLVGIPIITGNLRDLSFAFLRAEERALTLSISSLVVRVGATAGAILGCLALHAGLKGFVAGQISFEAAGVAVLLAMFAQRGVFSAAKFSLALARSLVLFGAPLLLFEMSSLVNDTAARFLIKILIGSAEVGIYSVGFNLASYVQGLVTGPLWMAIFPVYTKIWEKEGREATVRFLSWLLQFYVCLAVLLMLVVSLTSHELIVLLASRKFEAAATVTPLIIVSVLISGTTHITAAGFYLANRTRTIALLTCGCAVLNVIAGLILIPIFGLIGAAYAAVLSYGVLTLSVTYFARKLLPIPWPIRKLVLYGTAALVAAAAAIWVHHASLLVTLLVKAALATAVYAILVLSFDKRLRESLRAMRDMLRAR